MNALDIRTTISFLKTCKKEIKKNNCYFVGYRKLDINGRKVSAKQALIDIGIMSISDIWKHILSLEVTDCTKITKDRDFKRDFNSELFIFKKVINKKSVYIKLTLNNKGIICISFHESYGGKHE